MLWGFERQPYRSLLPVNEDLKFSHTYRTRNKSRLRKRRKAYRRKIGSKETHDNTLHLFTLRERIKETCTFNEICSVVQEAAWIVIKNYDKTSGHFWLYFIRYFRWKVTLLLFRHLRETTFYSQEDPVNLLTTPSIDCIINYSELNNWNQYLFWLSQIEEFNVRQIAKLTGISKTTIAEEIKVLCYAVTSYPMKAH